MAKDPIHLQGSPFPLEAFHWAGLTEIAAALSEGMRETIESLLTTTREIRGGPGSVPRLIDSLGRDISHLDHLVTAMRRLTGADPGVPETGGISTILGDCLTLYQSQLKRLDVTTDVLLPESFDLATPSLSLGRVMFGLVGYFATRLKDAPRENRWMKIEVIDEADWGGIAFTHGGNREEVTLSETFFDPRHEIDPEAHFGLSLLRHIVEDLAGVLFFDPASTSPRWVVVFPKARPGAEEGA